MSDDSDYEMRRELPTDIDWNKINGKLPDLKLKRKLARERWLKLRELFKKQQLSDRRLSIPKVKTEFID